MKRILSAGEGYVPFPTHINYRVPRSFPAWRSSILYTIGLFFMCLQAVVAKGADPATEVGRAVSGREAYRIGDKLPRDFAIGYDPFDPAKKVSLSDLKGKAVILDAWATWCGACISKFPMLDSLSRSYGDKLQIVLVGVLGRDTPETIRTFVSGYLEKYPDFTLTFLIEEPRLNDSFTFSSLPHYIWVDPNRRIRAYTRADAFEDGNLRRLMAGLAVYVPVKLR